MILALFDLDNTLLCGDSDHAWGQFLVERKVVDADEYRRHNDAFYEDYQLGRLDIRAYLEFALAPLVNRSQEELDALHADFMVSTIAKMRLPKADALIQKHIREGHLPIIITSTNRFITEPIAKSLGIDILIATEPERDAKGYTGKIVGTPCFREGKITRIHEWLATNGHTLSGSYFYSDSINDLPLLQVVSHPVAVDPDERLRQEAENQGWPIISLRQTPA
ncbi:HAD-superfamily hydrolase, subfamily IB [gamma proteobacterium HdN1]|nr:HAD-superfamily hydrolase, subfamily IB [gamma proteobacterium HdN1]